MRTIRECKDLAVASLSGKWGSSAVAVLVFVLIYYGVYFAIEFGIYEGVGSIFMLLMLPMVWGMAVYFLKIARSEKDDLGLLFEGFKDFTRIFLTKLLQSLYIFLWSLLLVVPGIIKNYSYAMTDFVLADEPEMKYNEAIERSMALMQGHKMDLFILDLSMIGWYILSILTCGIGFLFLGPYYQTSRAHFYEGLLADERQFAANEGEADYEEA